MAKWEKKEKEVETKKDEVLDKEGLGQDKQAFKSSEHVVIIKEK